MNNDNGIKFGVASNDMLQKAKENNGAVWEFVTAIEPDDAGVLREVEKGYRVYYPDGTTNEHVLVPDEFNEAGSSADKSVVSYLRNDLNSDRSAGTDNQVPGVQMVYDGKKNIIFSSPDKRNAIYVNGKLVQDSQKMTVEPTTISVSNLPADNEGNKVHNRITIVDEDLTQHHVTTFADSEGTYDYEYGGQKFTVTNHKDENGEIHTTIVPKNENARAVSSDGQITNYGQVVNPNALSTIKPALTKNQSVADYLKSGKKLDDNAIIVTYTTKKDENGNEVLDKYTINSKVRNHEGENNEYSQPGLKTILNHNNDETITWVTASGAIKPFTDSGNVIIQKASNNDELHQTYETLKGSMLGSDTKSVVEETKQKFGGPVYVSAKYTGDKGTIEASAAKNNAKVEWLVDNNNNKEYAKIISDNGNVRTAEYHEGYGLDSHASTDSNGTLLSLNGNKLDMEKLKWNDDQKKLWANYYDEMKGGTLTAAEKEKLQVELIENGINLSKKNGNKLGVQDGHIVEIPSNASSTGTTGGTQKSGTIAGNGSTVGTQKTESNKDSKQSGMSAYMQQTLNTYAPGGSNNVGNKNVDKSGMNGGASTGGSGLTNFMRNSLSGSAGGSNGKNILQQRVEAALGKDKKNI